MADRPRISPRAGRVVVLCNYDERDRYPWEVWNGWTLVGWFATHAEAITAATELARQH